MKTLVWCFVATEQVEEVKLGSERGERIERGGSFDEGEGGVVGGGIC